jgi:uncharacterized membrane protein YjdF
MLETIAIILIVLWLLGVVSGYTLGNFIYVLLVIAIVLFLVRLVGGRRVVQHYSIFTMALPPRMIAAAMRMRESNGSASNSDTRTWKSEVRS